MNVEQNGGGSSAIECSGISGQTYSVPKGSDCPKYNPTECKYRRAENMAVRETHVDFYPVFYVRTLSSRVNEAFRYARDRMLSTTLVTTFSIGTVVEDFKLPETDPTALTKLLRTIGIAR